MSMESRSVAELQMFDISTPKGWGERGKNELIYFEKNILTVYCRVKNKRI